MSTMYVQKLGFAAVMLAAALTAHADVFRFTVRTQSSNVTTDLSATTVLEGTFIGNFDAVNNPTGTRTIPGAFGGDINGNLPIPISGTAGFTGNDTTHPTGEFTLDIDAETLVVTASGLSLDMLSGSSISVTLGLVVEWDTFRTRQPTSLFIGGIPIPIPFGQVDLSTLALVQTDLTGVGVLAENGPGMYTATLVVPVDVTAQIDALGNTTPIGPITVPLALQMELVFTGTTATASFSFDTTLHQEIPFTLELPANQAFDLPTILPPGSTAHLLVNASVSGATLDFTIGATLVAEGARQRHRADWNNDGFVNSQDFFAFLEDYFVENADFDGSGRTNSQDFYDFLIAYFGA